MENHSDIRNQFVTYEIALKLNKLGFNEPCLFGFNCDGVLMPFGDYILKTNTDITITCIFGIEDKIATAPLWQQAIDWFREVHNFSIIITSFRSDNKEFATWRNYLNNSTSEKDLRVCEVSKPYFHEASQEDIDKLMESDVTWKEIIEKYSQPEWCKYPDALSGQMGCWSLIDTEPEGLRTKISKEFCKSCPECK